MNYPWYDYGWDFGVGPAAWRGDGSSPRWQTAIDDHLRYFQALGISVVRWFVLADGLTYGVGDEAPVPDRVPGRGWRFNPPSLSPEFLQHFDALLQRFAAAAARGRSIQLLPVLIDFHFCLPGTRPVEQLGSSPSVIRVEDPGWVKGGRADALTDASKREAFLSRVLEPLLMVSQRYAHLIYAWEIINEPDWVTTGWHPNPFAHLPVRTAAMRTFIEDCQQRIRGAGFKPTVGFGSVKTLRRSRIVTDVHQFHHYPNGWRRLEHHTFDATQPAIIGEFATAASDVWPELPPGRQTMLHRLGVARARGYPLALLWSFRARDRHTAWSRDVERDLEVFTHEL